jgi:hypothetical protein
VHAEGRGRPVSVELEEAYGVAAGVDIGDVAAGDGGVGAEDETGAAVLGGASLVFSAAALIYNGKAYRFGRDKFVEESAKTALGMGLGAVGGLAASQVGHYGAAAMGAIHSGVSAVIDLFG